MSKRVREMWERIKKETGSELVHMGKHGAHELAAALFGGSAFVMYPRGHHDDPQQAQKQQEIGGREM